jgi:hypothetical protein
VSRGMAWNRWGQGMGGMALTTSSWSRRRVHGIRGSWQSQGAQTKCQRGLGEEGAGLEVLSTVARAQNPTARDATPALGCDPALNHHDFDDDEMEEDESAGSD